jgi:cobalt-zinc-cadmium efflux system outer membrane protein
VRASEQVANYPHRFYALSACFDRADQQNREVLVAASNLPVNQASVTIAKAIPNPVYNMTYGFGPAWAYVIAGNNQQFGWSEEIQVAGRRTKKVNVARSQVLQTALQVEAVRFDVHNRIRRAYAELAAASAYAELIEEQRETAFKLLDVSQKRYDAGAAPGSEVLQSKLAAMQFDTLRNQARGRLLAGSAALSLLLGDTPRRQEIIDVDANGLFKLTASKTAIVPNFEKGFPALDELLPIAYKERKDLKAAIQQAYVNRRALTLSKTQRIPDPVIGFQYLFSTYKPYQEQYFTPQPNAHKVPYSPGYLLTVSEETPIFYQYQGQIAQAKAVWEQSLKQNEQIENQIATDTVVAYEELLVARKNIRTFQQELLPNAANVARLARLGYEVGKTDLATAILAQQQYQQIRSSYFDSVVAYQNAWADLEKAMGVSLTL